MPRVARKLKADSPKPFKVGGNLIAVASNVKVVSGCIFVTEAALPFPELVARQISQTIVCGILVHFGKRRVIEYQLNKRIHGPIQFKYDHPWVNQLGRVLADDVYAKQLSIVTTEDKLQQAV